MKGIKKVITIVLIISMIFSNTLICLCNNDNNANKENNVTIEENSETEEKNEENSIFGGVIGALKGVIGTLLSSIIDTKQVNLINVLKENEVKKITTNLPHLF